MGNGENRISPETAKNIGVAGVSGVGSWILAYAILTGQGSGDEVDSMVEHRHFERRIVTIESKLEPLVQVSHMIAALSLTTGDNVDAIRELKDSLDEDIQGVEIRIRTLETMLAQTSAVVDEYKKWVTKLSDRTVKQREQLSSISEEISGIRQQLETLTKTLASVVALQRDVRERLRQAEYQSTLRVAPDSMK